MPSKKKRIPRELLQGGPLHWRGSPFNTHKTGVRFLSETAPKRITTETSKRKNRETCSGHLLSVSEDPQVGLVDVGRGAKI